VSGRRFRKGLIESPTPNRLPDELAELAWGVAHPARVKILQLLSKQGNCLCGEIVERLPLAQSTVSQHLKILRDAGLICGQVDGPKVNYGINHRMLDRLKSLVADL